MKNDFILIDGKRIDIPEWASEATLSKIKESSSETAALIKALIKITDKDANIKDLLKEFKKSNYTLKDIKENDEENERDRINRIKNEKRDKEKQKREEDRRERNNRSYQSNLVKTQTKDFIHAISKFEIKSESAISDVGSTITGMVDTIGSGISKFLPSLLGSIVSVAIGAITGALGIFVGTLETYTNSLLSIADTGAALGMSLTDLKKNATDAIMSITDFSTFINQNASSLRGLGNSTKEATDNYSLLAGSFLNNASNFNYFGMTIADLNEILIKEIDIRRRSGQSLEDMNNNLAGSMNELLFQMMAMSSMTGQNRRDMMISREESLKDSRNIAYIRSLEAQGLEESAKIFREIPTYFSFLGTDLTANLQSALRTGRDILQQPELALFFVEGARVFGSEFTSAFQRLQQDMINNVPSNEALNRFTSSISNLEANAQVLQEITKAAELSPDTIYQSMANMLNSFTEAQSGMQARTEQETIRTISSIDDLLKNQAELGLGVEFEKLSRRLQESAFTDAANIIKTMYPDLSVNDISNSISDMVSGISDRLVTIDEFGNEIPVTVSEFVKQAVIDLSKTIGMNDLLSKVAQNIQDLIKTIKDWGNKLMEYLGLNEPDTVSVEEREATSQMLNKAYLHGENPPEYVPSELRLPLNRQIIPSLPLTTPKSIMDNLSNDLYYNLNNNKEQSNNNNEGVLMMYPSESLNEVERLVQILMILVF
jgi:hypothetical protein